MPVTRAAIVGCGDVAVVHLAAIQAMDDVELTAVCDTDPERLGLAGSLTGAATFGRVEDLLAAGIADVVHVTTPHHQHVPVTLACLDAGLHVLQEKPLAHTVEAAQQIVDAAASARSKIGVCFQNRYNASTVALRSLLESGALGELRGAYASVVWERSADYYAAKPWRGRRAEAGGGVLINQAIHTIDLVQWLLGDVREVAGTATQRKFAGVTEVEDTVEALFTHADGTTTTWFSTLTSPWTRPVELEVEGSLGRARISDGLVVAYADGRVETVPEHVSPGRGRAYWGTSHELLIRDFYARLADPEPFWISPAAALPSLRILSDIYAQSPALYGQTIPTKEH